MAHVNFAAHIDHVRNVFAFERVRDLLDRLDVGGDVFAFRSVAARCGLDQMAFLVANGNGEPIDLGLRRQAKWIKLIKLQELAHALHEVRDVLIREGIAKRQHGHCMAHFSECFNRRCADPRRRTIQQIDKRSATF